MVGRERVLFGRQVSSNQQQNHAVDQYMVKEMHYALLNQLLIQHVNIPTSPPEMGCSMPCSFAPKPAPPQPIFRSIW